MGDDSSIVQAARVSYGKDERPNPFCVNAAGELEPNRDAINFKLPDKDRQLIRYLLNHSHTTPFEMVEFKFLVRVPMDCWRQWIRHRTASVNEYSTRYTEAIDSQQTTSPQEWRLQATDNKQGSKGFLGEWPESVETEYHHNCEAMLGAPSFNNGPGKFLSYMEQNVHEYSKKVYQERLRLGIAKEQARKDLPLSTYTEAYWKCDLHNIFNFLRLRMDSHAQYEIRMYANAMAEIVKQIVPVAWEAFEDYVLHAKKFSRMEMKLIQQAYTGMIGETCTLKAQLSKPDSMSDREWKVFLEKLA
jgi:thymidylate synthase (FAD)